MRSESSMRQGSDGVVLFAISIGMLLFTWLLLMMGMGLILDGTFNPWDMVSDSQRPPIGTLERTVTHLFENGPASALLLLAVFGGQAAALIVGLRRRNSQLPAQMAALNLVFAILCLVIGLVFGPINGYFPQPITLDMGYARTWPGMLAFGLLFVSYCVGLWRLARQ